VNIPEKKHSISPSACASNCDFHRIFKEENDPLYRLSFVLTADREKAQQSLSPDCTIR
jgi:hypothetical protein